MDTCLCMGGSITIGSGMAAAEPTRPHVAFIGDSTFFHTGINGLLNAVYNNINLTMRDLDNRTTAMTVISLTLAWACEQTASRVLK